MTNKKKQRINSPQKSLKRKKRIPEENNPGFSFLNQQDEGDEEKRTREFFLTPPVPCSFHQASFLRRRRNIPASPSRLNVAVAGSGT